MISVRSKYIEFINLKLSNISVSGKNQGKLEFYLYNNALISKFLPNLFLRVRLNRKCRKTNADTTSFVKQINHCLH